MSSQGKQSPVLWISGPPGLGKSEFMEQLVIELNWGLSICFLSQMTIDMMSGLPMVKIDTDHEDHTIPWSLPEVFNFDNMRVRPKSKDEQNPEDSEVITFGAAIVEDAVEDAKGKDPLVILFFDDAHLSDRGIQKYMFQLLGQKTIHSHTLPPNVVIVLAGNRSEDHAGFQQVLAPIANRIQYLDVRYDLDTWIDNYAIKNNVRLDIVSFLSNSPEAFSSTPMESAAWASPRSWTYASMGLDQFEKDGHRLDATTTLNIVKGCVGTEYASAFNQYRELLMRWESDKILSGVKKVVEYKKDKTNSSDIVVEELDRVECYALMTSTVQGITKKLRKVNFKATESTDKSVDIFRLDVLKPITRKHREIVPLGLKILFMSEKEYKSSAITRRLLMDDEVVAMVSTLFK